MSVDYIIVGQGIAGTMLSYFLIKKGKNVIVIDKYDPASSSHVAGGAINPVTGKRLVKSWRIEELLPVAIKSYGELERLLEIKVFKPVTIKKYFINIEDRQFYEEKMNDIEFQKWVQPIEDDDSIFKKCSLGGVLIHNTFQLDYSSLLNAFRKWLEKQDSIINERFDIEKIQINHRTVHYKDITADKIIFCEGYQASNNKYFDWLPFNLAKGEILTVKIPGIPEDSILKKGIFLLPLGNNLFKVGSTYNWDFKDGLPTEKGKEELISRLDKFLDLPYEVVGHKAAIRPTVKDRRPFIGMHPVHHSIGIFNGLGTKGASLAPFFANRFADCLINSGTLDKEVDVKRFYKN